MIYETQNEFRSDTFTVPTKSMLSAAAQATLGDAVYDEDEDTKALEEKVAAIAGKQAGLFCVSGTLSNQVGIRSHLKAPPFTVLLDKRSHVYSREAGGLASLSQAMVTTVLPSNGNYLTLEDIVAEIFLDENDIHGAVVRVISLENTLHGMIFPLDEIKRISAYCKDKGIKLHLDGARLWNASAETGITMAQYCSYFDSVSLCLSKTLGAPVGSVLVGETDFIAKANHFRKQLGGGIRQSGILARMASVAIDENFLKLRATHESAKDVAKFCESLGIQLESPVETNFVFIDMKKMRMSDKKLVEIGKDKNVRVRGGRLAFHYQNSQDAIDRLKLTIEECYLDSMENPAVTFGLNY